jgi:Tfp pilus assembly protein PilF
MKARMGPLFLFAAFSFMPVTLLDQDDLRVTSALGAAPHRVVAGKVYTAKGDPVANATVRIDNNAGAPFRSLLTNDQGEFRADYSFLYESEEVRQFTVTLRVSKKGYEPARRIVEIAAAPEVAGIPVTLRPLRPEDPSLLSQADLIKSLAPRLRQLGPADGLPLKEAKDYARAVEEFLDRDSLDRAVPTLARVVKRNPTCLKCRTMLALAELRWGDGDGARRHLAESVNALIADQKSGSPAPLVAYGVLVSWEHEPAKASSYFAGALKYESEDALALQEFGRVLCLDMKWEAGSESLKKALALGAAPEARLLLAEALLWAGTAAEADTELTHYLNGRDPKRMPPRVRALWRRIQDRKKEEAASLAANTRARARGGEPIDYVNHPPQDLPDFEPVCRPGSDG